MSNKEIIKRIGETTGKEPRRLYEASPADLEATALAAAIEAPSSTESPFFQDMRAQAEAIFMQLMQELGAESELLRAHTDALRAGLTQGQQTVFEQTLDLYTRAYERSRRGLMGARARHSRARQQAPIEPAITTTEATSTDIPEDIQEQANALLATLLTNQSYDPSADGVVIAPATEIVTPAQATETTSFDISAATATELPSLINDQAYGSFPGEAIHEPLNRKSFLSSLLEQRFSAPSPAEITQPVDMFNEDAFMAELNKMYDTAQAQLERQRKEEERRQRIEAIKTQVRTGVTSTVDDVCRRGAELKAAAIEQKKRVGRVIAMHVSREGLVKAGVKLALPVAGAALPVAFPELQANLFHMQDAVVASTVSGFAAGYLARLPIEGAVGGFNTKSGRFNWRAFRRLGANAILAGVTALSLAQDNHAYTALTDVEARTTQAIAERENYPHEDAAARAILLHPENVLHDAMNDRIPLTDVWYASSVAIERPATPPHTPGPDNAQITEAGTEVVQASALPICFMDPETGAEAFCYSRAIIDRLTSEDITDMDVQMLHAIEKIPLADAPNQQLLDELPVVESLLEGNIGPMQVVNGDIFVARIAKGVLDTARGEGVIRGGSTTDMSLFKTIGGREGQFSMTNPLIENNMYHPERYSLSYAYELYKAIRRGEVLDPATAVEAQQQLEQLAVEQGVGAEAIALACEQLERYMYGQILAKKQGFVESYLNMVQFGSIKGSAVIGAGGESMALFGVQFKDASRAQKLAVFTAISPASQVFRAFENPDDKEGFTTESFRTAMLANVEQMEKHGLFKDEADKEQMIAEVNALFEENQFTVDIPPQFSNEWIMSSGINGDLRAQIESIARLSMQELAQRKDVRIVDGKILVDIELPAFVEPSFQEEPEIVFRTEQPFSSELAKLIETNLRDGNRNGITFFEARLRGNAMLNRRGEAIRFPEFRGQPGMGVIIMDERGQLIAKYDQTGGHEIDFPQEAGSTFKSIVYAYGRYKGVVQGPLDKTTDYPGRFGLAEGNFNVVNSDNKAIGVATFSEMLSKSRNVPFQKLLHDILYDGTEGMTDGEKDEIVGERWKEFQEFNKMFGLKIVNSAGQEITNPRSASNPTELAAIGTDAFVTAAENNMIEVADPENPEKKRRVLDIKVPSAVALLRFYLAIESPETIEAIKNDPKMAGIMGELKTMLSPLGIKGKDSFAKTGTVFKMITRTTAGTASTVNIIVMRDGDKVRAVLLNTKGADSEGNLISLDRAKQLAGVGNESFQFKPFAEWVTQQSFKFDAEDIVSTELIEQDILQLHEDGTAVHAYRLTTATREISAVGTNGEVLHIIPEGAHVDAVGLPEDGMQQIVWHEHPDQRAGILRTGFVPVVSLKPAAVEDINGNSQRAQELRTSLIDVMTSKKIQENIDKQHFFNDPANPVHFIVVGTKEDSPVLASFSQKLVENNALAMPVSETDDVLKGLGLEGKRVIVLNEARLNDFVGNRPPEKEIIDGLEVEMVHTNRTAVTEAMLARELQSVAEGMRFDALLRAYDEDLTLRDLMGDINSPAHRLLDALMVDRDNGYGRNPVIAGLMVPFGPEHPRHEGLRDIREIIRLYRNVMDAADKGEAPNPDDMKILIYYLTQLNQVNSHMERMALGLFSLPD